MKKISCLLLLLSLVITPLLFPCPVFAQENVRSDESVVLKNTETIQSDYFAGGERVTLSGTVNGDAYLAGGKIFVDGTVNGDLLIAGGTITIRGRILHNVRVIGGDVNIASADIGGNVTVIGGNAKLSDNAKIAGSLVAAGGSMEIFSPIGKGATIAGGNFILGNSINGNITGAVGSMDILPTAKIRGDVNYWSQHNANIAEEASISGKTVAHIQPTKSAYESEEAGKAILSGVVKTVRVVDLVSSLFIGLLLLYLAPFYMENASKSIYEHLGKNLLVGLVGFFIIPLLAIILLVTIIGIPLGILLLMGFFVAMYFGKIVVMFAVGQKVLGYTDHKLSNTWTFIIGAVVFFLATWIPFVGWLIGAIGGLIGFGTIITTKHYYYRLLRDKKLV